jgi:ABC-2 type transport system ATP-binding protein
MTDIIIAEKLSKSYGGKKAVDHLTLHVKEGEFFGFLGPNGSGKTTTIRMLTGILRSDQGTIAIGSQALPQKREKVAQIIGVMPESRGFYDWMTAYEYLSFFGHLYGITGDKLEERVDSLLLQVGLQERKHSKVGAFSFGMRQRLALARAIINNPKILFLDEPTLGLDPQGQEDIKQLLKKLNKDGVTIFLTSHLLDDVSGFFSRIGIINRGKLVAEGTMDELGKKAGLRDKTLKEIFLLLTSK